MEGTERRQGMARSYTLVFGIAYVGIALLEVVLGADGWTIGDGGSPNSIVLALEPVHNALNWVTGIALVASFLAGAGASRAAARVAGVAYLAITVVGFVAGGTLMDLLGYQGVDSVPIGYRLIHLLTAAGGLVAGFARGRSVPSGSLPP